MSLAPRRLAAAMIGAVLTAVAARAPGVAAQDPDIAAAVWDSAGFVITFPRSVSPDSITREMQVSDNFSGYEWRVVLIGDRGEALVTAFVIPPDESLALHRYRTIADAWRWGDLRRCERNDAVLACSRPARGFVRDARGRVEIAIRDATWLRFALQSRAPRILLVVKRDRQELWSTEFDLALPGATS